MGRKKKLLTKRSPIEVWNKTQNKISSAFIWPEQIPSLTWAETNRVLTTGESATSGKYSANSTPYVRGWHEAFDSPKTEQVTIVAGAQIGKTLFLTNVLASIIAQAPGNLLWVWPDLESAKRFARHRLKLLLQNKSLRGCLGSKKTPGRQEQILFDGGSINFCGSNNPTALASLPCRYVFCDEVDRLNGATSEGSAIELARARTRTFYNRKILLTSTPTDKGSSQIVSEFEAGSQERYCYCCPDCQNFSEIVYDDLKFELKKKKVVGEVSWICPNCGVVHSEAEVRSELLSGNFSWIARFPERVNHRSFWINSFVSPFISWKEIIEKVEAAKSDVQKLRVVKNTLLGELWEGDQVDKALADSLMSGRFSYGLLEDGTQADIPEGVEKLVAGVDTQDSYLAFLILGVGKNGIYVIERGNIPGVPSEDSTIQALKASVIDRSFRRADGQQLKVSALCWDSGGHFTSDIYRHTYTLRHSGCRVFAIKGQGGEGTASIRPPTQVSIGKTDTRKIKLFLLGVDSFKTKIFDFLNRGLIGFSSNPIANQDQVFFDELLSERLEYSKGKSFWQKIHRRNESLDCLVYAFACLDLVGCRLEDPHPPLIPACNISFNNAFSSFSSSDSSSNPNTNSSFSDSSSNPNSSPCSSNSLSVPNSETNSNSLSSSSNAETGAVPVNNLIQQEKQQQPKRRRVIRGFNPGFGFGNGGLGW